ncbi:MAG TPA: hypothetical protein VFL57_17170 [Bryobacteraceae bacterium]|nr:hypothetical protein [Bryobacteraceae bacterium]
MTTCRTTETTEQLRTRVAEEAWLGLALLHYEQPERETFTKHEIIDRIAREKTKVRSASAYVKSGIECSSGAMNW